MFLQGTTLCLIVEKIKHSEKKNEHKAFLKELFKILFKSFSKKWLQN